MNDFTSVWDDAGDSAEAQVAQRALANAKVASSGVWPFLALAKTDVEFGQRLELAQDKIFAAASANAVPVADLVAVYTREFGLLREARKTASCDECDRSDSGLCGTHKEEGRESLQDNGYLPGSKNASGATQAEHDRRTDLSTKVGPLTPFEKAELERLRAKGPLNQGGSDEIPGDDDSDDRTADERYGDTKWDDHYGRDGADQADDFYSRFSSLKTALEEGQDPLEWLEEEAGAPGAPEKAGGHQDGPAQTQASRRPF